MACVEKMFKTIHGLKPTLVMVVAQMALTGMNVVYKLAANDGMSLSVLVAYRFLFAAAFLVPIALYFERETRPRLTWVILFQAFLSGLFGGTLAQNLYAKGLVLTSATFASAMFNLIPAITFILAITFGMERLGWSTMTGKAKVVGTLIGIGGAMLFTFYQGIEINIWSTHVDLLHYHNQSGHVVASHTSESGERVLGALLVIGSCFSNSLWLIIQAKMAQRYPCTYSSTALMVMMGSIQSVAFALCAEREWGQWKLGWDIRLLAVAYSGIVASGLMFTLNTWCVRMRGPLFVSVFNPLSLVLVAIVGSLVLNEKLHMGSILGAILIIGGLHVVLWGKGKEMKRIAQLTPSKSSRKSEQVEIVITSSSSSSENNNNGISGSTIVNPNSVPNVYSEVVDGESSVKNKAEEDRIIPILNVITI